MKQIEIAEQIARDASCAQGEFRHRVMAIAPYLTDIADRNAALEAVIERLHRIAFDADDKRCQMQEQNEALTLRNAALEAAHVQMQASLDRMAGEKSYLSDEVIPALKAEVDGLAKENERLREALMRYREAQRWATGTEEHRMALQAADLANPVLPVYQQQTTSKPQGG